MRLFSKAPPLAPRWRLDDPEVLALLRPHVRFPGDFAVWTGPGWRDLVVECHRTVAAAHPAYELWAVKQKHARLAYQVRPFEAGDLTEEIAERSLTVCEWCAAPGEPRRRQLVLTLCDACDERFPDPAYRR